MPEGNGFCSSSVVTADNIFSITSSWMRYFRFLLGERPVVYRVDPLLAWEIALLRGWSKGRRILVSCLLLCVATVFVYFLTFMFGVTGLFLGVSLLFFQFMVIFERKGFSYSREFCEIRVQEIGHLSYSIATGGKQKLAEYQVGRVLLAYYNLRDTDGRLPLLGEFRHICRWSGTVDYEAWRYCYIDLDRPYQDVSRC